MPTATVQAYLSGGDGGDGGDGGGDDGGGDDAGIKVGRGRRGYRQIKRDWPQRREGEERHLWSGT